MTVTQADKYLCNLWYWCAYCY